MQNSFFPTGQSSNNPLQSKEDREAAMKFKDEAGRLTAAELIRRKVAAAYSGEPDAEEELSKIETSRAPLSPHQAYMENLRNSGLSLVEIQAAWHQYYTNLPNEEKHNVWREFYGGQQGSAPQQQAQPQQPYQPQIQAQPQPHTYQAQPQPMPAAPVQPIYTPPAYQQPAAAQPYVPSPPAPVEQPSYTPPAPQPSIIAAQPEQSYVLPSSQPTPIIAPAQKPEPYVAPAIKPQPYIKAAPQPETIAEPEPTTPVIKARSPIIITPPQKPDPEKAEPKKAPSFYNKSPFIIETPSKPEISFDEAAKEQPIVPKAPYIPEKATPKKQKPAKSTETAGQIKARILDKVSAGGKLKKQHHLQSLGFGLASGLVAVFILLFPFFNEVILAPFMQPSRHANETPVIVDPASAMVGETPKVIIPKINVEIPVDYSQTTIDDKTIEDALDNGIVHYPTTVKPGEPGNSVFFGHSSNNIFNPGKYKFAFVLLHKLVEGDTFYLTRDGKVYAYKVVKRHVVEPTEVGVLGPVAGYGTTATLITCDPPGTSLKRLVVVGEQISPAPSLDAQPEQPATPIISATQQNLPGNGPTLWGRLWGSIF